jgi:hypothetical protein
MKELWDLIKTILTTPAGLVALFGLILLELAAAGGVRYSGWLVIDDPGWRLAMGGLGAMFLIAAVAKALMVTGDSGIRPTDIAALGIKITSPHGGDALGNRERVTVTTEKPIPKGYELRVLRGYPGVNGFIPHVKLTKANDKLEWNAFDFDIGGDKGSTRMIEAWLIGPDGAVLLKAWEEDHKAIAAANHEIDRLARLANEAGKRIWLPPIGSPTKDMHKCFSIVVTRA